MKATLADTLLQLVGGIQTARQAGLVVTELDVQMPLEVSTALRPDGELVFLAQAPHSRWQAGFLPPVQRTRMRWALEE